MNKFIFILFLFYSLVCVSQNQKTKRLIVLCEDYVKLEEQGKMDSISKLIFDFESLQDLNKLEKQVLYFFKGNLNFKIQNHDKALENYKKSISFFQKIKDSERSYGITLAHIADLYFTKKNYNQAREYANKATKYVTKVYYHEYVNIYQIIGYHDFLNKKYDASFISYNKAEKQILEINDKCKLPEVRMKIAELLDANNKYDEALKMLDDCLKIAKDCKTLETEKQIRFSKLKILKKHNQLKSFVLENDSINKIEEKQNIDERNKKVDELETIFKTKLKDQENLSLKKINEQKDKVVKNQKIALFVSIIGIALLLGFLYLVYKLQIKQKQQNIIIDKNNQELKRLNILNQKIFSVISHDFKGPIQTLKLLLQSNNSNQLDSIILKNYLNDVNSQLNQADSMLNNLLDWAKTELISEGIILTEINLFDFIQNALLEIQTQTNAKQILINNNIPKNQLVLFNNYVLKIVVRNILSNAIKFSYNNGIIEINFTNNSISITDYGKGIETSKIERLFKQTVNPGLGTNLESGFGLGLYFSNELMLKNKGSLSAQNNTNTKGTTFFIHL